MFLLTCRAGDTIVIEPGIARDRPQLASHVVISWPLQLVGAGQSPEDTVLVAAAGAETALDFRYAPSKAGELTGSHWSTLLSPTSGCSCP